MTARVVFFVAEPVPWGLQSPRGLAGPAESGALPNEGIIKGRGFGVGAPLPELCSPRCPHFKEALPADITGTNIASATNSAHEAGGAEAQLRSGWQQVINGN